MLAVLPFVFWYVCWIVALTLSEGSCDGCEVALDPQFSHFQHQLLSEGQLGERGLTFGFGHLLLENESDSHLVNAMVHAFSFAQILPSIHGFWIG